MSHRRPSSTRSKLLRATLAVLVAVPVAVAANADTAEAACAGPSTKQLGGTLLGEDGRFVSAFIGIEFFDSARRPLDANGCIRTGSAYTHLERVNETGGGGCCWLLDEYGTTAGGYESTWDATAYQGAIPANAASAWIEVYPTTKNDLPATTNLGYTRYGGTMRRFVPLSPNIDIRLPVGCGLGAGGDSGSIGGRVVKNGQPVTVNKVLAWSRAADGSNPIMGFGVQQGGEPNGSFLFRQASPNQEYGLLLETAVGNYWVENDYGPGIRVNPCAATRVTIEIGTSPPTITPLPGSDTFGVRRSDQVLLTNSFDGGNATAQYTVGEAGDEVIVGDWNGDGVDTVGYKTGSTYHLTNRTDGQGPFTVFSYGWSTDVPVTGDWDGNGTDTIGIRRGNKYYLRNANSGGAASDTFVYGTYSDVPVTGDWDGNGSDTPGIRRGNKYYLRNSNTSGIADFYFVYGTYSDVPVTGDWDGNGSDTPGIRRGNKYYLRNSNTSGIADYYFVYGTYSDVPITGDWDGL